MARSERRTAPRGRPKPAKITPGKATPAPSGRYTPPIPKSHKSSPKWLAVLMLGLLVGGMLVVVCNYMNLLPGDANNGYLFLGLALIAAGFLTATRYR
jgi:Cell division protein CrgA